MGWWEDGDNPWSLRLQNYNELWMNRWFQRLIDWLTGALSGVARLHSSGSCLLWDTGDWQNFFPLSFCLLRACFWAKNGLFSWSLKLHVFLRVSIFTIFIKIWKSNLFLVFLNSLNSKNPTFSWVSWFPTVGPKPIVTGPKGFLNIWPCITWERISPEHVPYICMY